MNIIEAVDYLGISRKQFENYFKFSKEIPSHKNGSRWCFEVSDLDKWRDLKEQRTILLDYDDYKACFEFAVKMAYSTHQRHGTGIRGQRSEVQTADDFVMGIMAEFAVRKFLHDRFTVSVVLDTEVHQGNITPQDFVGVIENGVQRECSIGVAVKSSKIKSCFNVIPPLEYEDLTRRSDVYIFARVDIPSDHLFRSVKDHPLFSEVAPYLENTEGFRSIGDWGHVPVWITGFNYFEEFHRVTEIPGQKFEGHRYVCSVGEMHNQDVEWLDFIKSL
jgi:hypothetical protein